MHYSFFYQNPKHAKSLGGFSVYAYTPARISSKQYI